MEDLFMFSFFSFRFKAKENLQRCGDVFFDILIWITSNGAPALAMSQFRNFNRSLNKRQMSPAQAITTEWTAEKWVEKRVQSKQTSEHHVTEKTDGRKCRQTLATQAAKGSLSNNANNAKDSVD